ncbi:beta-ketoacyl synthase N-terminal-like domain-containing protein, partial [Plantactinospora sp. ZYX-F-223]|uniref:beta-ketoacyl synthase N-terminal-like domain-containing protein n=1 Tax=Plantactinospora sp. ZYX-F-223 TaxID=3144103 RepID=UPI0031FDCFF1
MTTGTGSVSATSPGLRGAAAVVGSVRRLVAAVPPADAAGEATCGCPVAFDPGFLGTDAADRVTTDPRGQVGLEVCWAALEQAGVVPSAPGHERIGLFVLTGPMDGDNGPAGHDPVPADVDLSWSLAEEMAGVLGLGGPTATLDVRTYPFLAAMHAALAALDAGAADVALVCGVDFADACAAHRSTGPERGAEAAVVVLKPLAHAVANHDVIDGVLRAATSTTYAADPDPARASAASGANEAVDALRSLRAGSDIEMATGPFAIALSPWTAPVPPYAASTVDPPATIWAVSGRDEGVLRAQAARLRDHLMENPAVSPRDVGYTLAVGRARFARRGAVVGHDHATLLAGLSALASGEDAAGVSRGDAPDRVPAALVFPGIGSHWPGMATELLDAVPVFRAQIDECAAALAPLVDWSLPDVLRGSPGAPPIGQVGVLQPVWFAVTLALAELWRSFGFTPDAVVGHSIGEISAACFTGALSLDDGARVATAIGHTLMEVAGRGDMAALRIAPDRVAPLLRPWGERLTVAGVNGPGSVVISGDTEALDAVLAQAEAMSVQARRLSLGYAAHSGHIDAIEERLVELLAPIRPRTSHTPFYSCAVGGPIDTGELDARYWARNLRDPFEFETTTRAVVAAGFRMLVEVSPHPVVAPDVEETCDTAGVSTLVLGTLRRSDPGFGRFLSSLAEAYTHGADVDLRAPFADTAARRVRLPGYPFRSQAEPPAANGPVPADGRPVAAADAGQALRARLAPLSTGERRRELVELVRAGVAALLGQGTDGVPSPGTTFGSAGIDSLMAVDLRNRLGGATGLRLPTTLVFDYPTPRAVAEYLDGVLTGTGPAAATVPEVRVDDDEPIAIIGMSCRLPGGISSPEQLWDLVINEGCAISDPPRNRGWDLDALYSPEPGTPGRTYTWRGGFVHDADEFDPAPFGISPREALAMDPQQRLLLETSWEAFERAGIDPLSLRGTRTGVFAGLASQDYAPRLHDASRELSGHLLTGNLTSVASGRIAYTFGLEGPAVTIDTACSSSLVALHLAVQSLRRGESTLGIAAGAMIMSGPGLFVSFAEQ